MDETKKQSWGELVRFAVIALLIVVPIRLFVIGPFMVSGSSMVPTFQDGNYLIVDKLSYRFENPDREDVVVFIPPVDSKKFYIKRIIGLPGETVNIEGNTVTITNAEHKEGFTLDEPYVKNIANSTIHRELGSDEYFVMGDNRSGSSDSRIWGPVKKNSLVGRAFLRLLPVSEISILPGHYEQTK